MSTATTSEVATSREQFFVPADIYVDPINCGDDRPSDLSKYIHVFGGALFVAYQRGIMQEVQQPGSTASFVELATTTTTELKGAGVQGVGVHSDTATEGGDTFHGDQTDGAVGCGYAAKRAPISALIAENGEAIIHEAAQLLPELFIDESSWTFARKVTHAHGRLAERAEAAIGNGRTVVTEAQKAGASIMLVDGSHVAEAGIINTRTNSTFDTNSAHAAELPSYDHDLWASSALLALVSDAPERQQAAIASVIDVIGTMKALGVQTIEVR